VFCYQVAFHGKPPFAPQGILLLLAFRAEGMGDMPQHVAVTRVPEEAIDLLGN